MRPRLRLPAGTAKGRSIINVLYRSTLTVLGALPGSAPGIPPTGEFLIAPMAEKEGIPPTVAPPPPPAEGPAALVAAEIQPEVKGEGAND